MKRKLLQVIFLSVLLFVFFFPVITHAVYGTDCPIDSTDPNCQPPTLGDFQTMVVSLIGTGYALIGVLFMGILIFNGLIYLLGYIEDAKYILGATIEDAQKRMTQWLIGFLMVIISYPLINTFMHGIVGKSECYSKLNNPTVQFIFPTVCFPPPAEDLKSCKDFKEEAEVDENEICKVGCNSEGSIVRRYPFSAESDYSSIWCNCDTKTCHAVIKK